jgi:two-component system copper resistance phosphate regulon response regulator CusR
VADLEVDLIRQRVTRGADDIDLAPKEFALLSLFVRNEGQALSRARIAEEVWDMKFEGETNVVDVAVRRLRAKMDDPYEKKLIHTVRGVGYVLADR